MGNNNVMGLRGGVLAAIIVMMILFFSANQSCAAGNITNFHIDPDVLFFHDDPELELAAAPTSNKALDPSKPFGCGRPGSIRSCPPHPNAPKKPDHCAPAPGSTYAPAKRDC